MGNNNINRPRHGSLQFWPRRKFERPYARVRSWAKLKHLNLLGFVGYKVGMTHLMVKDNRPNSPNKGDLVSWPVTVLECPSIKIFSIRFYKKTPYGLKVVAEVMNSSLDKDLVRKLTLPKESSSFESKLKELTAKVEDFYDIRVNVYTQPKKAGVSKKKPEILELGIGGTNMKDKLTYALGLLGKEIKVSDILKQGSKVDVHAITTGKGFQGTIKRFGVQLRSHKAEKKRRGNIFGSEIPSKIHWGTIMPGRMGFNLRTEYNKDLLFLGNNPDKINPKGGFLHYGLVKGDYVLVKGSIPGTTKRLITLTEPIRGTKGFGSAVEITYVSQESKQ